MMCAAACRGMTYTEYVAAYCSDSMERRSSQGATETTTKIASYRWSQE